MRQAFRKFSAIVTLTSLGLLNSCNAPQATQKIQERHDGGHRQSTAGAATPKTPPSAPLKYTVVEGDVLEYIAQAAYGDFRQFTQIVAMPENHITDPDLIFPGQVLMIPNARANEINPRKLGNGTRRFVAQATNAETVPAEQEAEAESVPTAAIAAVPTQPTPAPSPSAEMPATTATAAVAITQAVSPASVPLNIPASAPAPKAQIPHTGNGPVWYAIRFTPSQAKEQVPDIREGTFAAVALDNQISSGKWQGRWQKRRDTGVIVTRGTNGSVSIYVKLAKMPTKESAVAFISGGGIVLPDYVLQNQGAPTRAPTNITATSTDPKKYAAQKKELHKTFKTRPNAFLRTVMVTGPIVARTGVGFALAGPLGAMLVNAPDVMEMAVRKIQGPPSQMQDEASAAQPTTKGVSQ